MVLCETKRESYQAYRRRSGAEVVWRRDGHHSLLLGCLGTAQTPTNLDKSVSECFEPSALFEPPKPTQSAAEPRIRMT